MVLSEQEVEKLLRLVDQQVIYITYDKVGCRQLSAICQQNSDAS